MLQLKKIVKDYQTGDEVVKELPIACRGKLQ